jgi:hypothetical protein
MKGTVADSIRRFLLCCVHQKDLLSYTPSLTWNARNRHSFWNMFERKLRMVDNVQNNSHIYDKGLYLFFPTVGHTKRASLSASCRQLVLHTPKSNECCCHTLQTIRRTGTVLLVNEDSPPFFLCIQISTDTIEFGICDPSYTPMLVLKWLLYLPGHSCPTKFAVIPFSSHSII